MKVIAESTIAALNARAKKYYEAEDEDDRSAASAIYAAANDFKLTEVRESPDGQVVLFRNKRGGFVNAWLEAPEEGFVDGGCGFDTQVELHTDEY